MQHRRSGKGLMIASQNSTAGRGSPIERLILAILVLGLAPGAALAAEGGPSSLLRMDVSLLVRIVIGTMLACAIGWEREFRGSEAGDRTFALVSLGAAAFTAVGV